MSRPIVIQWVNAPSTFRLPWKQWSGSGVSWRPYVVWSAEGFDALMQYLCRRTAPQIILRPGHYLTRGQYYSYEARPWNWYLPAGASLTGSGATIVRAGDGGILVTTRMECAGHVRVEGITVDGGMQDATAHRCIHGIGLRGSNNTIRKVYAINMGTRDGNESFWLSLSPNPGRSMGGGLIEGCHTYLPGPNTSAAGNMAIAIHSGPGSGQAPCIIRNCSVLGSSQNDQEHVRAFAIMGTAPGIVRDCLAENVNAGYYSDSWDTSEVSVRNCRFDGVMQGCMWQFRAGASMGAARIENCEFRLLPNPDPNKGHPDAITSYNSEWPARGVLHRSLVAKNNVIKWAREPKTQDEAVVRAIELHAVGSVEVADNIIDLPGAPWGVLRSFHGGAIVTKDNRTPGGQPLAWYDDEKGWIKDTV